MENKPTPIQVVLFMVLIAALGGFMYWQNELEEQAQSQEGPPGLARMTMSQAVAHCRTLWRSWHYDQAPLAVAWHRQGVDWYVLEGVDTTSMRHYRCDGNSATKGARYQRVLGKHVPPPTAEPGNILSDRNLFDYVSALPESDARAWEATEDPATRKLVERRWLNATTDTGTSNAQSDWPDQADFPILFRHLPADLALEPYPVLKELPDRSNWLRQPARVFALLAKHLPRGARIAEMTFNDNSIDVTVTGPVKNFDNKPPAPFGSASFDEYGVRDSDYWYPRDQTGSSCTPGHTLSDVATQFAQAPNAKHPELFYASFSCKGANTLFEYGSWTLRVPRRRR